MISKEIKLAFAAVLVVAGCKDIQAQTPGTVIDSPRPLVSSLMHRSNAVHGLVFGNSISIDCPEEAVAFQIRYEKPTQGQGFYESSGGLIPGQKREAKTYVNANNPDGEYTGSVAVECIGQQSRIITSQPVDYKITLTSQALYCEEVVVEGARIGRARPSGEPVYVARGGDRLRMTAKVNSETTGVAWEVDGHSTGYRNSVGNFEYPGPNSLSVTYIPNNTSVDQGYAILATVSDASQTTGCPAVWVEHLN